MDRIRTPKRAWTLALLGLLGACRSAAPEVREFLLRERRPAEAPARTDAPLPSLRMKPLVPRSFLDRNEIAWREGDVRSGTWRYQRWAEPPAEMVTRALLQALRDGGAFVEVDGPQVRSGALYTLSGELLGLHEVADAQGGNITGVVEIELALERTPQGSPLPGATAASTWTLRARKEVAAADPSIEALVRALSDAADAAIGELARAVADTARANEAAASGAPRGP